MKVRDLRSALNRELSGLNAEEIKQLDRLLAPADQLTITEFCAATKIKVSKPKKPRAAPKINEQLVGEYVSELIASMHSDDWDEAMARLKKDKGIKVAEARMIAMKVVGERTYKTKADAFKAIEQRRIADARARHRLSHIDEIF